MTTRDDLLVTIGPQDEDWPDGSDDEDGSIEGGERGNWSDVSDVSSEGAGESRGFDHPRDLPPSDLDSQSFPAPVSFVAPEDDATGVAA